MFKLKASLSLLATYACLPTYGRIVIHYLAQNLEIRCRLVCLYEGNDVCFLIISW
jgi:hypothetical protein